MLNHRLAQAGRRIRTLLVYRWVSRALCAAAAACLFWLLASKAHWIDELTPGVIGIVFAVAALAGLVIALAQPLTTRDVARLTDKRTSMRERFASAVEFVRSGADDPILRRQIQDAGEHAGSLNLRNVYPLRLSREAGAFVIIAAILFGSFFLPSLPMFWSDEKRQEMEQVRKQGIAIEKVARDSEKSAARDRLDETKKAAADAKKLAQAMKAGKLTKKQTMVQMQKLTAKISQQHKKLAAASAPKSLQKASEEFKKALAQQNKLAQDVARAKQDQARRADGQKADPNKPADQKAQEQLAQQQKPQTEAMKKAQEMLQKFAQALADQNAQMQNEALQELAQQMEQGGMTPQEMQQLQQQLQQLSQALSKTELDEVAKQMAELAKLMEGMKLDAETLKKLAQMMRAAGGT